MDASGTVRVRASRPTLVLVPRAEHRGGNRWAFDNVLPDAAAFNALVDAGLAWLASSVLGLPATSTLARGPLTLMAHSGGGSGLSRLLDHGLNPDEVVCFDSMYGDEGPIGRWAAGRISSPGAATSALRAFYTRCSAPLPAHPGGRWVQRPRGGWIYEPPGSWQYRTSDSAWHLISTEVSSRRLQHAITQALSRVPGVATTLASRFRVERTSVGHSDIPSRYTPLLLEDISANVPNASTPPATSVPPVCVDNRDWLTAMPRKPGGDAQPPSRPQADPPSEMEPDATEDVYTAPDARAYTPSSDASLFRTPPTPVAVRGLLQGSSG